MTEVDVAGIVNSVQQAVVATDRVGTVILWNRVAETLYGWMADEAIGRPLAELTRKDGGRTRALRILEHMQRREPWAEHLSVEEADGREVQAFAVGASVVEEGEVIGSLSVSVVGSDLALHGDDHRGIIEVSPDPIFRISSDGRYVAYVGPAEAKLFVKPEQFLGKRIAEVLPAEVAERCTAAIERALSERTAVTIQYELDMPGGVRVYETRMAPAGSSEVIAIVRDITESRRFQEELYARVNERTAEIETLSKRLLDIQEEERRSIGRELHDDIGQLVTSLSMLITAAHRNPQNAAPRLREAITLVDRLQKQVRDLSFDLAPSLGGGLAQALHAHAAVLSSRANLRIDVVCDPLDDVPPRIQIAAFRIVQEALTNVVRHAAASSVSVRAARKDGALHLAVVDDGVGFDASSMTTVGLPGMTERARLAGGQLMVHSEAGRGTSITAELPLDG